MISERRPSTTRSNLRNSSLDGMCYCVMMGAGEANIVVFALALGFGERFAGLLAALPLLGGALLHLVSPWCVNRLGSHKRWLEIAALAQALAFVPLIIAALVGSIPGWLLMLIAAFYWGACFSAGSTWNTYIGVTTPKQLHAKYFALRSRVLNIALVVSTVLAGAALHQAKGTDYVFAVFAGLFLIAAVARGGSWFFTIKQTEPVPIPPGYRRVPWSELASRYRHGPGGRMIAYALFAQLALQVSSPFVTPYLLEQVGMKTNYAQFGVLTAWVLLAKVVAVPLWGKLAHARGPHVLLRVGGVLIIPLPLLWLLGDSFAWLLVVQTITGAALAAYELSVFLMLLRSVPDHERTSVMTKYQVVSQSATVIGSLIGVHLLTQLGHGWAGFAAVFAASCGLRAIALLLLARVPSPTDSDDNQLARLCMHASDSAADEPVLATVPHAREAQNSAQQSLESRSSP
jgi:MFS family permease